MFGRFGVPSWFQNFGFFSDFFGSWAQETPKRPQERPKRLPKGSFERIWPHSLEVFDIISQIFFNFPFYFWALGLALVLDHLFLQSLPFRLGGEYSEAVPPFSVAWLISCCPKVPLPPLLAIFSIHFFDWIFLDFGLYFGRLLGSKFEFFSIFFLVIFWLDFWIDCSVFFWWFWKPRTFDFINFPVGKYYILQNRCFSLYSQIWSKHIGFKGPKSMQNRRK